jgi:hypothetical protein
MSGLARALDPEAQRMKVLVVAQTAKEAEWACRQAARQKGTKQHWYVLQIGDAVSGIVSFPAPASAPPNCTFLNADELEVDAEALWEEVRQLQGELWAGTGGEPRRQLALAVQWTISDAFCRLVCLGRVIEAALERVRPDEVGVPPLWCSAKGEPGTPTVKRLQWLVYSTSVGHGVRCRRHWSATLGQRLTGLFAGVEQSARYGLLMGRDLVKVAGWLGGVLARTCWPPTFRRSGAAGRRGAFAPGSNTVLIANADTDLDRQFDLSRLPRVLKERCWVWHIIPGRVGPLAALPPAGREGKGLFPPGKLVRSVFPTLVTPLVLGCRKAWFGSPISARVPAPVSERLRQLLGAGGAAAERLHSWRCLVFAARLFAMGCDLLKALRPDVVVVSDWIDTNRALTLAARQVGVPSLATAHGIQMGKPHFNVYGLADLHCEFGRPSLMSARAKVPGGEVRRVVCYDRQLIAGLSGDGRLGRVPEKHRRILLVTGTFNPYIYVRVPTYARSLHTLVESLAASDSGLEITIKCHPLADHFGLYEDLRRKFPGVVKRLWREPLPPEQPVPADVVVMFNYQSTLVLSVIQQGIPVLAHWGALTAPGHEVLGLSRLAGSGESCRLAEMVREILNAPEGPLGREARLRAESFLAEVVEPPLGGLAEAIELARENYPRNGHSTTGRPGNLAFPHRSGLPTAGRENG